MQGNVVKVIPSTLTTYIWQGLSVYQGPDMYPNSSQSFLFLSGKW